MFKLDLEKTEKQQIKLPTSVDHKKSKRIPWMEELDRLQSMSQTRLSNFTFTFYCHALEKEMATHSSVLAWRIPGMASLVGCHLWGHTESDTAEVI